MALNNSSSNSNSSSNNNNNNNDTDGVKQNKLVVRIDQDSDDNLQLLFDSVLKPGDSKRPLQVPFSMRKLPKSFFNPPSTGSKSSSVSHSRENSADSAFGSGSTVITGTTTIHSNRLPISHSRAHSSPASLQQSYAAGINPQQQNNNNNSTSGTLQQQQQQQANNPIHVHMKQRSYDVVSAIQLQNELGNLPQGWEQARTAEGQIYYLNHITRSTQWEDPRKQLAAQQALAEQQSTESLLGSQQNIQQQSELLGPLPEGWQEAVTGCGAIYFVNHTNGTTSWFDPRIPTQIAKVASPGDPLGQLPEGWEQAVVASAGEIYFINHINRTTSWYDPRIPEELQRPRSIPAPTDMLTGNNIGGWLNNNHNQNIRQLEREREFMRQRQLEIRTQVNDLLMRQSQQAMELQVDPFLSGATDHARQESTDSGLSLSSNNVSLPQNSDFLSNIDDNMDCLSECGNLDSIGANLENTDDLISSFQLTDDLLSDVNLIDHSIIRPNSKW